MMSTFFGLETALRGILAQQAAIDTTGHNISNANTTGFTRQEAVLEASPAYTYPAVSNLGGGQIGSGVDVTQYKRVRDDFIDIQLRAQTMRKGYAAATDDGLNQVQLALAEPGDNGLNSLLGKYWSAWQDVANAPENVATRQALAQNAQSLATGFNSLASQLSTIQTQTAANVQSTVAEVNAIGKQIASLTQSIVDQQTNGNQPNDLKDQRDVLIDRLSQLANVSVTQGSLGSITVNVGGTAFVTGSTADTLLESGGVFTMQTSTATATITSGKLNGLVALRDTTIPGYQAQLDTIAAALIGATNAQHALGYDLSGSAGGTFFSGANASTIAVDPAIMGNVSLIAASSISGQTGNSTNALALASLRTAALVGPATVDTAYSTLVTQIGSDAQDASRTLANASALSDSLENRRQSVSGVSLDEEMANLTRYQRGFQASARALNAMDEMVDILINRMGKVGL
jgi:flagellar hook-associated protein 1 FlgK